MSGTSAKISAFIIMMCCLCFVQVNDAYSGVIPADLENPGKCIYRGDLLKLGENFLSPCQRLTCKEDGSILVEGCGKLRLENCNQGERINADKFYPKCCELRYKCKNSDGSYHFVSKSSL